MYINEEEITRMTTKLSLLYLCCDIKDLGYKYEEDDCVIIDLLANEDGFGGPTEYEIIESIIKPTIGVNGFIESNHDNIEKLKELGADIPQSHYSDDDAVGALIFIDNKYFIDFAKYKLKINDQIDNAIKSLSASLFYNESTVEDMQVFFKEEGAYIVCPEEYLCVEEFLNNYIELLGLVTEQVLKAKKEMKQEEAA